MNAVIVKGWIQVRLICLRMMTLVMLISVGLSAQAHKVNMFAFAEGSEVFVEGYFTDGKKPKKCEVIVYDVEGKALLTGMSNEDGQFSFAIPAPGELRITLNAGEGHMAEYVLAAEELGMDDNDSSDISEVNTDPTAMAVVGADVAVVSTMPENKELQVLVSKATSKAMRPVMRALDELKERRTMSDIIGGVGIIMGIGGLLLYFQARKMTKKQD